VVSQLGNGRSGQSLEINLNLAMWTKRGACAHNHEAPIRFASINLTHLSELIILERLLYFRAAVHHERAVADDRFGDGFAVHHE
jgi:hypothetical protein